MEMFSILEIVMGLNTDIMWTNIVTAPSHKRIKHQLSQVCDLSNRSRSWFDSVVLLEIIKLRQGLTDSVMRDFYLSLLVLLL